MKNVLKLLPLALLMACGTIKGPTTGVLPSPEPDIIKLEDIYKPYSYTATVTDVYDGDTFTLDFEIGFSLRYEDVIRLARVDTPELRGEERPRGIKVRDAVEKLILNKRVIAQTDKDDRGKYGRLLSEIYFQDLACQCWVNLSDYLLQRGMAELY